MSHTKTVLGTALATLISLPAAAGEPAGGDGEASGSVSLSTDKGAKAKGDAGGKWTEADKEHQKRKDMKWIKRWAPEKRMMGELGLYGGLFIANKEHELYGADPTVGADQGWKPYRRINGDIGLRAGFYPIRFFGIEAEGGLWPLGVEGGSNALGWTARAHLVGQIGLWSVTPFVLLGAGAVGVSSDPVPDSLGKDIDPGMHFGGGLKFFLSRYVMLRLDGRGILSYTQGLVCGGDTTDLAGCADGSQFSSAHAEVLLGLSFTLGRERRRAENAPPPPPKPTPTDRDGDGILDEDDECPDTVGVPEYNGCPIPDTDGDGILDPDDKCVDVPGVEAYEGCPIPDTDGDGILDPDDQCVEEPESKNGYQDGDGCPDEIPEEIKRFTGVIEGIYFDTNKDTIKSKSKTILNKALKVLKDFPQIRLKISGHTDSRGGRDHNMDLSKRRAASVKNWMIDNGIDASRLETDGFGPDQPIETNETKSGRAKNRRIEFSLLSGEGVSAEKGAP